MRALKMAAVSLFALAAAAAPVMAQGGGMGGPPDPAAMAQRSSDRMLQGLTLSAAQTDSVKAINARYASDMTAAMQSAGGDRTAMRAQMTTMRTKQRADIRAILTADQQAIFDRNVIDMDKARANRSGSTG